MGVSSKVGTGKSLGAEVIITVRSTETQINKHHKFLFAAGAKLRDVLTFVLLGRNVTLPRRWQRLRSIGKETHANAEESYGPLYVTPFCENAVYDCPYTKLMD